MTLRVITPPAPFVTPADIPSSPSPTDAGTIALIAAAVEEIDGPQGWLGRAIGPQTLELRLDSFGCREIRLPCPPVIGSVEIKYLDTALVEQTWAGGNYDLLTNGTLQLKTGFAWPATGNVDEAVRVRYQAGYNGAAVSAGGTGPIPVRIKQAIIFSVQQLAALGAENLFLSAESVDGVGGTNYVVSPNAETLIRTTMDRLLNGLRVYA